MPHDALLRYLEEVEDAVGDLAAAYNECLHMTTRWYKIFSISLRDSIRKIITFLAHHKSEKEE
jgi:hypothetical protein